jgi:hypothetical protein
MIPILSSSSSSSKLNPSTTNTNTTSTLQTSDRHLVLWLNTLPIPRAVIIDELNEVTTELLLEILSFILERKFTCLKVALRYFENTFKLAPSNYEIDDGRNRTINVATCREILLLVKCVYDAGRNVNSSSFTAAAAATINPSTTKSTTSTTNNKPIPHINMSLSNILELIMSKRLAIQFSDHFQSQPGEALSDGVLLTCLIHALETKMGMPPRNIVTKCIHGENEFVHVFVGIDIHPKTRAARLNNVDIALRALREWKRPLNPRFLWSGPEIVSKRDDIANSLVHDILVCAKKSSGIVVKLPVTTTLRDKNSSETTLHGNNYTDDCWDGDIINNTTITTNEYINNNNHFMDDIPSPSTIISKPMTKQLNQQPYNTYLIPPILITSSPPILFSSPTLVIGATAYSRFFQSNMVEITPEEELEAREWLFEIGFNWLRVDVSKLRKVDIQSCATKEFFGYEGGPFLGDPLRNGTILNILASMLVKSQSNNVNHTNIDENLSCSTTTTTIETSFPAAQSRVTSSLEALRNVAKSKGIDPPPMLWNVESVLKGNINAIWSIIYALSLVFPVVSNQEDDYQLHVKKRLFRPMLQDIDVILWPYLCGIQDQSAIPRTRKKALEMLKSIVGIEDHIARRIHDGDWRLLFSLLKERNITMLMIQQQQQQQQQQQPTIVTTTTTLNNNNNNNNKSSSTMKSSSPLLSTHVLLQPILMTNKQKSNNSTNNNYHTSKRKISLIPNDDDFTHVSNTKENNNIVVVRSFTAATTTTNQPSKNNKNNSRNLLL